MSIASILDSFDFKKAINARWRYSIADHFNNEDRCGIYVLHFENGSYYVGQTVDVVKRFAQHINVHKDIVKFSFRPTVKNELNNIESRVIGAIESEFEVRNISLASTPQNHSAFDGLITIKEQGEWLNAVGSIPMARERTGDEILRKKYNIKFIRMMEDKLFVTKLLPVMKKYVSKCIPEPYKTEISFWGCTCLPGGHDKSVEVYSRINLHWQEVFTTLRDIDNIPCYSFHLALSPFKDLTGARKLLKYIKNIICDEHYYQSGGQDQFNVQLCGYKEAMRLLDDNIFLYAVRLFNLRNMRKSAHAYARYHCMYLADLLLPD